jgi:hypothetical protein|eukprot:COSAG01_NODE_1628_length_9684_cov_9.777673_9_plen_99_part_00
MGVNGARAASVAPPGGIANGMARSRAHDVPAIVFHALIGNDVCNGHPGMEHMTTPEGVFVFIGVVTQSNENVAWAAATDWGQGTIRAVIISPAPALAC